MSHPVCRAPRVSVVLPTYNERENIAPLIRELRRVVDGPVELLVVDDDSPDGTAEVVERLARDVDGVRLIRLRGERGLTTAIQRGIDEAAGDVVVWMDCDFSMPPEKVPELVAEVLDGGADAAIGSRYVDGGAAETGGEDGALVRVQKFLTRRMNRAIGRWTGLPFHDWTSGFIAIRGPLVKTIRLRGDHGEYFIALVAELFRRGAAVVERPYRCVPRRHGESKSVRGPFAFARTGMRYLRIAMSSRSTTKG